MLEAVDRAWDDWVEREGPIPSALVTLMKTAHTSLLARVAKMSGDETVAWGPPETALLRLEKIRAALLKQIEQKNRMS
jgi:hypothetical protein